MNAIAETRHPVAAPHATHKLKLLIRREYWENKGGFVWAPAIVGIIATIFVLIGEVIVTVLRYTHAGKMTDDIDSAQASQVLGGIADATLLGGIGLAMAVVSFVVFFYTLGSLYDDRRDRSILFWKSMPISDTEMVLSKLAWSVLLAPLAAMAVGLITGLVFWLLVGLAAVVNGVPGTSGLLVHSHPFRIVGGILLALPAQMLWSLPTVGWLMLCSAWSRRLPFLVSVSPILAGALLSFLDLFPGIDTPHKAIWYTIYRGLVSAVPGSWIPTIDMTVGDLDGPHKIPGLIVQAISEHWQIYTHADIWIGAVIGVAMIFGAIRLRRWREEG
jgi:ABC-2 type transport system permease protein